MIENEILSLSEHEYMLFSKKLIPNQDNILGLRAPHARAIAKKYANTKEGENFLNSLPHKYHDENMVHAYMLGYLRCDYLTLKGYVESFLPYLDNWAVCDSLCASIKKLFKEPTKSYDFLVGLLKSDKTYTVRFSLVCLLDYYINESYIDKLTCIVKEVKRGEYYINMALAWLISIMLVKEYDKTLPLLKGGALDLWVHNKSIQKARESYRLSIKQKEELRSLKR